MFCRYFTLDKNLKPVGGKYSSIQGDDEDEESWNVIDYIE